MRSLAIGTGIESMREDRIKNVIGAYDDPVVRAYCRGRFQILRQRFLDEIGQYLPDRGRVLDVGCGIGLFSLYYAQLNPELHIEGIDLNERRVHMARAAAQRLGLRNVRYERGSAVGFVPDGSLDGAYILDVIHHIPEEAVRPLLTALYDGLMPGGRLLIKDVDTHPAWKRIFTHALDLLMDPKAPVRYWSSEELPGLLGEVGFTVYRHCMVDYLPYPHILYVCEKASR